MAQTIVRAMVWFGWGVSFTICQIYGGSFSKHLDEVRGRFAFSKCPPPPPSMNIFMNIFMAMNICSNEYLLSQ